jgi:hypothetical protein
LESLHVLTPDRAPVSFFEKGCLMVVEGLKAFAFESEHLRCCVRYAIKIGMSATTPRKTKTFFKYEAVARL